MTTDFFDSIKDFFDTLLGTEPQNLKFWQTMIRAVIIYILALAAIRLGKKRLLGRNTAFDVILGIIIGSVFGRAINGSAPFLGTLTAGFLLVILHWIFATIAVHIHAFGSLIKGEPTILLENGEVKWDILKKHDLSEKDLKESMRLQAKTEEYKAIQLATLERNGSISFITKEKEKQPKIIEIDVKEGVQRIRIEIQS
jgi:uncharacterized membrane protein YcaP (DUF421 family)